MKTIKGDKERFSLTINMREQYDIIDNLESEKINGLVIYNDLGHHCCTATPAVCELLNQLHNENMTYKQALIDSGIDPDTLNKKEEDFEDE